MEITVWKKTIWKELCWRNCLGGTVGNELSGRNCDGEKIIHICHTFDLKILNGRTKGDPIGNFTHLNSNKGESTIDYGICNELLYACIENFMVLPLYEISDHSKIVTVFKNSNGNGES